MKKLSIELKENSYDIYIKKGIIENVGLLIKNIYENKKIIIVTDENVDKYYGHVVYESLMENKFEVKKVVLKSGEKTKGINSLLKLYEEFLDYKITRSDLIIALGGGVIGDLTGFAAATFLRGVPFIQIPTSLLAQIDSSIGGKVAIDLPQGKNLVGNFYHPIAVFIDPNVLSTLEPKFFKDGMGEVIKYGCIRDKKLFDTLLSYKNDTEVFSNIENIIYKCCLIKKEIVQNDEKDNGERMLLNFGHTLAHALEKYFDYEKLTHGEAVAIGMYNITVHTEEMGITKKGTASLIKEILQKYKLNYKIDVRDWDKVIRDTIYDKKNLSKNMNIIVLFQIGKGIIEKINKEAIDNFIGGIDSE